MRTLALNGCMWYIVSLTGFRVGRPLVVISSLRVNYVYGIFFLIFFINAYIVGTHLDCLDLLRQFK